MNNVNKYRHHPGQGIPWYTVKVGIVHWKEDN